MVDRVGSVIEEFALVYGIRLRVPSTEFAGLIRQAWADTSAFATMTRLSATELHPIANKRTARFVATLVEPNSD
ncbi:hypothetical protein OWM54_10300 [Myxococcus sp. MISCRS1]|jgi:hypothetical protein|uniref:hypothetical protein n=1 Tax=unclassified Myxococcus TaxID=2648731 RepID=UPI001CBEA504|nr:MULTISPECIES: hypothetical protein [unclassified Myxococcus]MBZ4401490.1 hypothetical protein [Myxococcus sp. AS-1-15]MBZ4412495.1 hypothetical protein [Myxococcus sp. XM-1-1-1]MCY0997526.1 hypothetical protein [Myxococcus sp. MISCRS1]